MILKFYEGFPFWVQAQFLRSNPFEFLIFLDIKPDGSLSNILTEKKTGVRIQNPEGGLCPAVLLKGTFSQTVAVLKGRQKPRDPWSGFFT